MPATTVHILLVDDEGSVLTAIERAFMVQENWEVIAHNSAESALAYLKTNSPDIIISDERMPGISGSEFLAMVKKSHPDVPRIILTGQADQSATIRAINDAGVYRFMQKPWNNTELIQVVEDALAHVQSLSRQTDIGLALLKQKNELAESNKRLQEQALAMQSHLENSKNQLEKLNEARHGVHADVLRLLLAMTAVFEPSLVTMAKSCVEETKRMAQRLGMPTNQDLLDAALLVGLYVHAQGFLDANLARFPGFERSLILLRDSREAMNGSGPRAIPAGQLEIGARLLRVIHDYHTYNRLSPGSGMLRIAQESFRIYDSSIAKSFLELIASRD